MTTPSIHNIPRHGMSRWSTAPRLSMPRRMKHPRSLHNNVSQSKNVTGSVLYYARAVDPTFLMPLNDITTEQTEAREKTQAATNQMLDYLATHPDATIRYHASDTVLHIHSDASYLSVSNAQSRLRGLFFFWATNPPSKKHLMDQSSTSRPSSKTRSPLQQNQKLERAFATPKVALRVTLSKMGHTQPRTPLRTDSSTAYGIVNETIKQKRSKAMDMRYHWLTDRVRQKQFNVYWRPGREHF
jgi:hypothetical protein